MVQYGRPALLRNLAQSQHCAIEASAGTGKTYTLEHLILQLILEGTPLEAILVVTFTRKATLELKARLRAKLTELTELGTDSVRPGEDPVELTAERLERLQGALMAFDRATISTIHGFCQQVLQDGAFEGGQLFQQEAISSDEAFDRAFTTLLRQDYATRHAELLRVALGYPNGLTGLRELLKQALKEADNLDLPAFRDARSFLEAFPVDLARAVLAKGGAIQAQFPGQLTSIRNRLKLILERLETSLASASPAQFWQDPDWIQDKLLDKLGPFCAEGLGEDAARLSVAVRELANVPALLVAAFLPPLRQELQRFKAEEGLFDFDDMIDQVARTLSGPRGEGLVQRLRERFRVALIDEFQDTDRRQWSIFRRIFQDAPDGHRLFLVGDPKQAIYGFRGGDLPTYVGALEDLARSHGAQVLNLATNFRSTEGVIQGYNAIFRTTDGVPFFAEANARHYLHPVTCGKPQLRLSDAAGRELPPVRVVDVPLGTARTTKLRAAQALAGALAETLQDAQFHGTHRASPKLGPADVFVLTRTLGEGRMMAEALRQRRLPVALYRQDGLFDGTEAQACRDLLLAIDAPFDASRRAKALLGPFFGLSFPEAERARNLPEGHPILGRLFGWRDLALQGRFGELFHRVVADSGLSQRLLFLEDHQRTLTNLLHILELLQQEALGGHRTLLDLAIQVQRWIDDEDRPAVEEGETQRIEGQGGAVQILTMHKAKGLQAAIVVLFGGCSQGPAGKLQRYHQGPGRRAWVGSAKAAPAGVQARIQSEEQEEGERLAYVALTRAEAQLILPCFRPGEAAPSPRGLFDAAGDPKSGLYRAVNQRLRTLLAPEAATPAPEGFQRLPWAPPEPAPLPQPAPWPMALPAPLAPTDFATLRRKARPLWMYSYSSLQKGLQPGMGDPGPLEEVKAFTPSEGPRGGRQLGTRVHALLQRVAPASFTRVDLETWQALPAIRALAETWLPREDRREALRWVYHAMTVPYPLPGGGSAVLHQAEELLRELDFLTPYPERPDFLHGSIDVLFQAGGRAHVLDWKTNALASYAPDQLERTVAEHYRLQVQIYTLTACRFLGIRDRDHYERAFGGVLYVFLRGLPEAGIWTARPAWEELQAWTRELDALRPEQFIPIHAGGLPRD
jgi:exodeoxyribonuclease V beta subunit